MFDHHNHFYTEIKDKGYIVTIGQKPIKKLVKKYFSGIKIKTARTTRCVKQISCFYDVAIAQIEEKIAKNRVFTAVFLLNSDDIEIIELDVKFKEISRTNCEKGRIYLMSISPSLITAARKYQANLTPAKNPT